MQLDQPIMTFTILAAVKMLFYFFAGQLKLLLKIQLFVNNISISYVYVFNTLRKNKNNEQLYFQIFTSLEVSCFYYLNYFHFVFLLLNFLGNFLKIILDVSVYQHFRSVRYIFFLILYNKAGTVATSKYERDENRNLNHFCIYIYIMVIPAHV